jgi:GT2 family glycosyltransferase
MDLSLLIVVLHYSGLDDTMECVASLGRQSYLNVHTIVVDNGSAEKPGAAFAASYPWVEVIEMAENRGWSGGNNVGIALAIARNYDMVCLLNNDTVLPEHAIARLMETAAVLGPCVLHPAIDSYGDDHQVQLDPSIGVPPLMTATAVPFSPGLFEISSVNGACLLAHVDVFRKIGLIDERFFLLCEDADLGARALAAGFHLFCDVAVRIQHKESRSFGGRRKPIKTYYGIRNTLLCWEKHPEPGRTYVGYGRDLLWMLSGTAEAVGLSPRSRWGLLGWCLSGDVFARAVRMALRDYLLRRFGRVNRRDESILMAPAALR